MNLDSPSTWRWIWFVMAGVFAVSEIATAATFFFLPFAIGAAAAGILCAFGVNIYIAWIVFFIVSVVAFAGFWRMGRKVDQDDAQEGIGATRWVGQEARVVEDIDEHSMGMVQLEREKWRAESLTGISIPKGTNVVITQVTGTRLVVVPVDQKPQMQPPPLQPNSGGSDRPAQGAS